MEAADSSVTLVPSYQNTWSVIHEARDLHIPLHENLISHKQFETMKNFNVLIEIQLI
jgi:hypothetical protein